MTQATIDLSKYMPVEEFIRKTGYGRATVFRWIDQGLIESELILNARLIPLSEFDRIQTYGSPLKTRRRKERS